MVAADVGGGEMKIEEDEEEKGVEKEEEEKKVKERNEEIGKSKELE